MSEYPRHQQYRKMYQGELAYSIRLAKQRNVEKLELLLFQFAKAGKSSPLILSKEPRNTLLRVSYKWATPAALRIRRRHRRQSADRANRPAQCSAQCLDSNRTINDKCKAAVGCSDVQLGRGVRL